MSISKSAFAHYVRNFELRELFNDMGWNNDRTRQPIAIKDATYLITGLAEKSGFRIFSCAPVDGTPFPDKENRKKIDRAVTKLFQEHLIIYYDDSKTSQIWQLAVRKADTPAKISEIKYLLTQDPELLYQRASGLFFTLDEEDKITIVDVTKRVSENFQKNNEVVTKKFYEGFKKEHTAFLKFIDGIGDKVSLDWYASLMLNRLMFCYFIQKQRFLDNNENYLQDKLKECKQKKGKNKFYSFYRDFLLALFHKGLGAPNHGKDIEIELGKIPYLNGGLFDVHELEKTFTAIQIDDKAFLRLFSFFDEWNWHLDTREAASGKDINPDVIGYIFEKYINDRAQMGAYYTKEDITDYISKNCIIPWLFDEVKRNYSKAFAPDSWLWLMVKHSGTDYIYDAVKHGVPDKGGLFDDLPPEVQKGFVPELEEKVVDGKGPWLWEQRKAWNKPAPGDIALPTEIYREVIERRKRCAELIRKIDSGEIQQINDFITNNLNIRQFVQDVVETTEDPDFLRHFYKALSSVTILDPTCGSGAFLFAAMNILEPLYETCIERMQELVTEEVKGKYKFFEDTLKLVNAPEHPNLQYFIYKSIILNNLYGVDIMNEAVEIAKLRLFLKLMATVEADYRKPNIGLEPLPDVDFNIRAGNTLVGYATKGQIDNIAGMFVTAAHKKKILEQCDVVARAFERYKEIQLSGGGDYKGFKKTKDDLNERLKKLTDDLDKVCFIDQYTGDERDENGFQKWVASHKPFHWFAEYYEIVQGRKGFDVVIGNPPYVKYSKINYTLNQHDFKSLSGRNIYSPVIERSASLSSQKSYIGMITPVSICSGSGFVAIMDLLFRKKSWVSSFSNRPGKLFDGVEQRLSVFISTWIDQPCLTSPYQHWYSEERETLFSNLCFTEAPKLGPIPLKAGLKHATSVLSKICSAKYSIQSKMGTIGECWFHDGPTYWVRSLPFYPSGNASANSSHYHCIKGRDKASSMLLTAILSSSSFYLFFKSSSNCRDFGVENITAFRVNQDLPDFTELVKDYKKELKRTAKKCSRSYPSGTIEYDEYYPSKAKGIIDQIDSHLAKHYGFTHSELDFIINYDIKYRMGKELDSEGGDNE